MNGPNNNRQLQPPPTLSSYNKLDPNKISKAAGEVNANNKLPSLNSSTGTHSMQQLSADSEFKDFMKSSFEKANENQALLKGKSRSKTENLTSKKRSFFARFKLFLFSKKVKLDAIFKEAEEFLKTETKPQDVETLKQLLNADKQAIYDIAKHNPRFMNDLLEKSAADIVNNRGPLLSSLKKLSNKKEILKNFTFSNESKGQPIKQFAEIMLKLQSEELKAFNADKVKDMENQDSKLSKATDPNIKKQIKADRHRSSIQVINYTTTSSDLDNLTNAMLAKGIDSKKVKSFIKMLEKPNITDQKLTDAVFQMDELSAVMNDISTKNTALVQQVIMQAVEKLNDENKLQEIVNKHKHPNFSETNLLKNNLMTAIAPFILSTESFEVGLKTNILTEDNYPEIVNKFCEFVNRRNPGPLGDAAKLLK